MAKKEDPHTIKEGEIQITSNADIESIVSQCSSPEFPKALENKNFGTPPYPAAFYKEYYGPSFETNGKKDSNKLPLWIYVNSMYDAGYKAEEAEKFIETQCNTIKNNITETFKNIQNFSKPEVDTICDKWPIDDSYLIRKSCRGSFIYTYILQQLFVEGMLEWNSIIGEQVDKFCAILSSSNSGKPDLLIRAGWFKDTDTAFKYNNLPNSQKDKVKKSLGCLDSNLAKEIVDKYISGNLDSIKIGKDTKQAQLIKSATSDPNDNVYNECTKSNKALAEKVKDDLYGSDGKLEKELDALISEIEGKFWSETEATQKQKEFQDKCVELGFKATKTGNISPGDSGTQITGLEYEVDPTSENYAKQLLEGVEATGGFLPAFGIVGTYDGISGPVITNGTLIDKGEGANEAFISEAVAQAALDNTTGATWAQFKTTNTDTVKAGGYEDKKENYIYNDPLNSDTPTAIKKKPNGLVDYQNQSTFNITSANTYPFGDFNFVQTLKKQLISIQRNKAEAEGKGIGTDFELIYGDKNSNPTYYIGPITCYDCILKNYYETFGYNGMPEDVKKSEKFINNRLNKLFNDFSKTINSYFSEYNNEINKSQQTKDIFSRMQNIDQPVFTDNIFDGLFIGENAAAAKLAKSSIDNLDQSSLPQEKDVFSLLVYWLKSKFPMDNIQFYEDGKESKLTSIFFTDIVECFKYEVLDTLQKWGSAFNGKIGSFDLMVGQEVFNDLICSPAGVLIASCYYNQNNPALNYATNDKTKITTIKNNIMKVLNIMASANILEKIIIKNLDIVSVNKYVVYKLIELAEGAVSFVKPPAEEEVNDTVGESNIKGDLRQPARYFNANNSIGLADYNWGPVYNLEHTKIDPNAFSRLILWEFQPAAVTPTKTLVAGAEQFGGNAVNTIVTGKSGDAEKAKQGMKTNTNTAERFKTALDKNDKSFAAVSKLAGSAIVNYQINALADKSSQQKEDKVLGIDWIKNKLPGKWVGRYEIPFFNNHFMKTKTKDSWTMGNALNESGSVVSSVRDGFQNNVQDVPVWDFNKDPQEGINWSTSFFLINDNIGNVKKNISFLMSFAAGSYWLQIDGYQYHCPNLYRVECPGRFFELYTSLDILVQYYGKTRKILKSEAKIFDESYKFKLFNELLNNNQLFIPEAYEIKIDSKSLQPNAFNIQYNYFIRGALNLRPDGNISENGSGNFSATAADKRYSNPTSNNNTNENVQNNFVAETKRSNNS